MSIDPDFIMYTCGAFKDTAVQRGAIFVCCEFFSIFPSWNVHVYKNRSHMKVDQTHLQNFSGLIKPSLLVNLLNSVWSRLQNKSVDPNRPAQNFLVFLSILQVSFNPLSKTGSTNFPNNGITQKRTELWTAALQCRPRSSRTRSVL